MKTRRKKKPHFNDGPFTMVEVAEDFETVCQACYAEFLDEEDLKLHIAQVHLNESNGRTICKICFTILPNADEFVSHFIFKHLESSAFCFHCARVFSDAVLLDQHEIKHGAVLGDSRVMCSQCTSNFTSHKDLVRHEFNDHDCNGDGIMLNKHFALLSSALNMKIKKLLDGICKKKAFVCCKCNYSSLSLKDYIEHLKTSNCKCLVCDKCLNVYKKKFSIKCHMFSKPQCHNHTTETITKETCEKCGKTVDSKDIADHKKSCNAIKCSICDQIFDSVYQLAEHRATEHNISINLKICKFCKKEFVGMQSLKKHMTRSHKNKSLYKYNCVYCDSRFTHPRRLFAHFFTQHKHIEPYTCKICDKRFRLRKHFTIHIKLEHKSIGFVEFDDNLHVIFTDKKSNNPIGPPNVNMESTTDFSDSDGDGMPQKKRTLKKKREQSHETVSAENTGTQSAPGRADSDTNASQAQSDLPPKDTVEIKIGHLKSPKIKRKRTLRARYMKEKSEENDSLEKLSNDSEDEPLSNIRGSLLREKSRTSTYLDRKTVIRDKRAKLTCKICKKFCYTVQNYHHHLTLHERSKMKRCIKCNEYFKSRRELKNHLDSTHSSSKLIETLKSVLEKRKTIQPEPKVCASPGESLKCLLEKRKKAEMIKAQNSTTNKFRRTIRKVNIVDDCTATITPMSDHGLSVKNFIENFRPEADSVNISNSVTIKAMNTPVDKEPSVKMHKFNPDPPPDTGYKLSFPVKFKDPPPEYMDNKVSVKLVQQLITKPKLVNMSYNERIPVIKEKSKYCNMFADETDYTQYKNDIIPEVAHEVMLGDLEDIPRIRRLAQEIIIPKIPEKYGGVRIGHLLPQAPYYKVVKVKKLLQAANETECEPPEEDKDVMLPDGTRLISVKNPYSHLIPNEHLQEVLKANRTKYYKPKTKNIEKAIAKALTQVQTPRRKVGKRKAK